MKGLIGLSFTRNSHFIGIVALFFLTQLLSIHYTVAQDLAVVFGGGCDIGGQGETPSFGSLASAAHALSSQGWKVQGYFGGNQGQDRFAAAAGLSQAEVADKEHLLKSLDHGIQTLQSGEQFLLVLDTHGSEQLRGLPHAICTATTKANDAFTGPYYDQLKALDNKFNGKTDGDDFRRESNQLFDKMMANLLQNGLWTSMNDPAIISRLKSLRDKGVKIGILDGTCYSGATTSALSSFGCVLSATSVHKPSLMAANANLIDPMVALISGSANTNKSPSLDDLFLESLIFDNPAHRNDSGANFDPQISSFPEWTDGAALKDCIHCASQASAGVMAEAATGGVKSIAQSLAGAESDLEAECRSIALHRAKSIGMPQSALQEFLASDEYKSLVDMDKCKAFLRHLRGDPTVANTEERASLQTCADFHLIHQ